MQYMKLQIEFGGDINEIMVPFNGEPIVADLIVAIEQQLSIPAETQRLIFKGQNIHEYREQSLRSFGICNSNKIRYKVLIQSIKMQFMKLQIEFGGDIHEMWVPYSGEPIVADLMVAIEDQMSVPVGKQRLVFKGQSIQKHREKTLGSFGICNSTKIRLAGRKEN